jgi:hypothetical protein
MLGRHKSTSMKQIAERRFPFRVDIVVPSFGLGQRLDAMTEWCRSTWPAGSWAHHGHRNRPAKGATPVDLARFYFDSQEAAQAFRSRWAADGEGPG